MSCKFGAEYHRSPYLQVPTYIPRRHIHAYISTHTLTLGRRAPPSSTLCLRRGSSEKRQRAREEAARLAESGGEATPIHGPAGSRTTAHTHTHIQSIKFSKKYVARGSRDSRTGEGSRPADPVHAAIPLCLPGTCSRIPVKEATVRV